MISLSEDINQLLLELEERVSELEYRVEKLSNVVKMLTTAIVVIPQELIEVGNRCRSLSDEIARMAVEYQYAPDIVKDKSRKTLINMIEIVLTSLRIELEKSYNMVEKVIDGIEEFDTIVAQALEIMIQQFIATNLALVVDVVFAVSKELGVEFREVVNVLLNSLGRDLVRSVVDTEVVSRYYGKEFVEEWRKAVEG